MLIRPHKTASQQARWNALRARAKQAVQHSGVGGGAPRGATPEALAGAKALLREVEVRKPGRVGWEATPVPQITDGAGGVRVVMVTGSKGTVILSTDAGGTVYSAGRQTSISEAIVKVGGELRHRTMAGG